MLRALTLAALVAFPGLAQAATGLIWNWDDGTERRYLLNNQVQLSQPFWMKAQDNIDRRILEWKINAVTTCRGGGPLGKKANAVTCTIDDIAFSVTPTKGDEEKTAKLVEEYDTKLTGATLLIKFGVDGKLLSVDLDDVKHNRSNDRTRQVQETMRLMLLRALAGIELQLPPSGDDKGKTWQVRDPMIMDFPSLKGTTGGLSATAQVAREKEGKVVVETGAEGTRGPSITDNRGKIVNLWDMKMFSRATFDTANGELVKQETLASGKLTPSSTLASGGIARDYVQAASVERIGLDDEVMLPPNQVVKYDGTLLYEGGKPAEDDAADGDETDEGAPSESPDDGEPPAGEDEKVEKAE